MSDYPEGIPDYMVGRGEVINYFPINRRGEVDHTCDQCDFFYRRERTCFITKELIAYPDRDVGRKCPLQLEAYSP